MLPLLDLHTWTQWDQSHYLEIADTGYRAFPCPPQLGFNDGDWCGNAAWFPLYPLAISLFSRLLHPKIDIALVGVIISNVFFLATLLYLIPLLSKVIGCNSRLSNIAFRSIFFVLFPSSIFFHANYPLSLALFAAGLCLFYVYAEKPLHSIPLAFIACTSYPPLLVLSVPIFIYNLKILSIPNSNDPGILQKFYSILSFLTPLLSYRLSQLYIDLNTGVSNSFSLVGAKYGHGLHNPIYTFKSVLIRGLQLNEFSSLQTLFLLLCILCITTKLILCQIPLIIGKSQHGISLGLEDVSLLSFSVLFLILPMVVGGAVSTYRTESLSTIGIVILFDKWITHKILRLFALVFTASLFAASMNLFLEGRLV